MTGKTILFVPVRELQADDQVLDKGRLVYTVLEIEKFFDSSGRMGAQTATVQWMDGGRDHRAWDVEHLDQEIQVCR